MEEEEIQMSKMSTAQMYKRGLVKPNSQQQQQPQPQPNTIQQVYQKPVAVGQAPMAQPMAHTMPAANLPPAPAASVSVAPVVKFAPSVEVHRLSLQEDPRV